MEPLTKTVVKSLFIMGPSSLVSVHFSPQMLQSPVFKTLGKNLKVRMLWMHQIPVRTKLPTDRGRRLIKASVKDNRNPKWTSKGLWVHRARGQFPKYVSGVISQVRVKGCVEEKASRVVKRVGSGASCLGPNVASSTCQFWNLEQVSVPLFLHL